MVCAFVCGVVLPEFVFLSPFLPTPSSRNANNRQHKVHFDSKPTALCVCCCFVLVWCSLRCFSNIVSPCFLHCDPAICVDAISKPSVSALRRRHTRQGAHNDCCAQPRFGSFHAKKRSFCAIYIAFQASFAMLVASKMPLAMHCATLLTNRCLWLLRV